MTWTQDRAAPAKILLNSGADPNALVSLLISNQHDMMMMTMTVMMINSKHPIALKVMRIVPLAT